MPRYIAKLAPDNYVEWSTVVDAPVSHSKTRAEAVALWTEERIARADANGTSAIEPPTTLDDLVSENRAGPRETRLTLDKIIERCRPDNDHPGPDDAKALHDAAMDLVARRFNEIGRA